MLLGMLLVPWQASQIEKLGRLAIAALPTNRPQAKLLCNGPQSADLFGGAAGLLGQSSCPRPSPSRPPPSVQAPHASRRETMAESFASRAPLWRALSHSHQPRAPLPLQRWSTAPNGGRTPPSRPMRALTRRRWWGSGGQLGHGGRGPSRGRAGRATVPRVRLLDPPCAAGCIAGTRPRTSAPSTWRARASAACSSPCWRSRHWPKAWRR